MTGTEPTPRSDEQPPRDRSDGCACPYKWGSYGRLYGISMGHGWLRMSVTPGCPVHDITNEQWRARAARSAVRCGLPVPANTEGHS